MKISFKFDETGKTVSGNSDIDFVYNLIKHVYGNSKKVFLNKLKTLDHFKIKRLDDFSNIRNMRLKRIPVNIRLFHDFNELDIEFSGIITFSNLEQDNDGIIDSDIYSYVNKLFHPDTYEKWYLKDGYSISYNTNTFYLSVLDVDSVKRYLSTAYQNVKGMSALMVYHKSISENKMHYKIPKNYDELRRMLKKAYNLGYAHGCDFGFEKGLDEGYEEGREN